ncbi:receptor protein-tyrosine kinase [Mycobacterium sp. OAS707]|uniref:polysaccharide biosynthesis tyrosine autokinase n=1 Tax=Mycobacterium sp. OAS707 TaxID=2663822 RepID=UPI001789B5A9|nr:polysaccharide biosynthesis tyrosine autokinase [Mycobacterium sp. OAS707]MBE1547959.1 receptor protein-tyrosine kinase [Mycobacterium sp. OAS707]
MTIQNFLRLLRARWITIFLAVAVAVGGAAALTLLTTPLYEASTRLYVSTTAGASATDIYEGNLLSQERVFSYAELLMGKTAAQRTIDKLHLDMTAQQLQKQVKATTKRQTVLIDLAVRDASPTKARDIANTLSDELVEMVRELETSGSGAEPDARVVVEQRATTPTEPVVPKTAINMAGGLALGVLLGIALALLRDRLDNTIRDQQIVEEITGVGVVGSIPFDKELRNTPAIHFDNDNTPAAEAFRKLRTNLQFLAVDNPPRLIVFTSSEPSEGKTTAAINTALVLAESEHNVVLVDGDMRRPRVDKYLDLIGSVGFSTVLSGGASLSEVLQKSRFPRLTVLTSGAIPPNPSELLASLAARKVLSELRTRFDYVIVDSSPLLAVTDGAVLAAHSDGALILARYGQTKRDHLAYAVKNLEDVGASLLGAAFTMTPEGKGGAYHYRYYGSYVTGKRSGGPGASADGFDSWSDDAKHRARLRD